VDLGASLCYGIHHGQHGARRRAAVRYLTIYGEDNDELVDVVNDNVWLHGLLGVGLEALNPIFI
jgi:hypothetical protein